MTTITSATISSSASTDVIEISSNTSAEMIPSFSSSSKSAVNAVVKSSTKVSGLFFNWSKIVWVSLKLGLEMV